jgi:hypothetical protein
MKRQLRCVVIVLLGVFTVALAGWAQSSGVTTDPEIASMLGAVNSNRLQATDLVIQHFFTRQSCSDTLAPGQGVTPARDYLFGRYSAIPGLQVRLDQFTHPDCPSAPTFNVIAWLPGTTHPNRLVIVGGHYDSRTVNVLDNATAAPGGNDAGGQTSVLLEIAAALSGHKFDSTVVFISFSGEEQGLFGSAEIANNLGKYFTQPVVVAMFNTDIPGGDIDANTGDDFNHFRVYSPGIPREILSTDPDGTTDQTSPARGLMRYVGTWSSAYLPNFTMVPLLREDRPGRASDHVSFISAGDPAVRIMERFECSPSPVDNSCGGPLPCPPPAKLPAFCSQSFLTDHQHNPNDLNKFITPSYAAQIAQVMISAAATLARAPGAPQNYSATGNSVAGVTVSFQGPKTNNADHYVVAARSVSENFYRQRIVLPTTNNPQAITAATLGFNAGDSFYISVASVDKAGHESLFAYPEVRCDSSACAAPAKAMDFTRPMPPPASSMVDD